jgi:hypothetical protein
MQTLRLSDNVHWYSMSRRTTAYRLKHFVKGTVNWDVFYLLFLSMITTNILYFVVHRWAEKTHKMQNPLVYYT